MRVIKGPLNQEDTTRYVEATIARERATTELQLTLRRLQAKYHYGAQGGVDPETGEIQLRDGTRPGTKIEEAERTGTVDAHERAELATLEWQALLLRLREDYAAPMTAFPDDDGDWVSRAGQKLTESASVAGTATPAQGRLSLSDKPTPRQRRRT